MAAPTELSALPYHLRVADVLQTSEPELWSWFSQARSRGANPEETRTRLLETAYRLSSEAHTQIHEAAQAALTRLGLTESLSLYQAQESGASPNASILSTPGEIHIILQGPLAELLDPIELKSVFGHELGHHLLWSIQDGRLGVCDDMLHSACQQQGAQVSHVETTRRFRLQTEIFADRAALLASGDLEKVVSALVKVTTATHSVSGADYLAQAAEVFSKRKVNTDRLTHPECFIRAHALALWSRDGSAADERVAHIIDGEPDIDRLDILQQVQLQDLTKRLVSQLLRPRWMQTEACLSHARLFDPGLTPAIADDATLTVDLSEMPALLKDYFLYVILDLVHIDQELGDYAIAHGFHWAEKLDIFSHYEKALIKPLGLKAADVSALKARYKEMLSRMEDQA